MRKIMSMKRLEKVVFLLLILGIFSFTSYSETKDSKSKDDKLNNSTILKEKKWVDLVKVEESDVGFWQELPCDFDITCDSIYLVNDIPTEDGLSIKKHSKDDVKVIGLIPYYSFISREFKILVDGDDVYLLYATAYNVNIWRYNTPNNKWQQIYRRSLKNLNGFIENEFSIQLLPNKELYLFSCKVDTLGKEKIIVRKYTGTPEKWDQIAEIPKELTFRSKYYVISPYMAVINNGIPYIAYTKIDYDKTKNEYLVKIIIKEGKLGGKTWTVEDEDLTDLYNYEQEIDSCLMAKNNEIYIEYTRRDPENREGFDLAVKKIKGDSIIDVCHLPSDKIINMEIIISPYSFIPSQNNIEVMNNGDIYIFSASELAKFHDGSSSIIYKVGDRECILTMHVYNKMPYILVYTGKEGKYILKYLPKD